MLGTDAYYYPMIALAFICMMVLALWRAGQVGLSRWKVFGVCLAALLFGIAGARIGYVLLDWGYYRSHLTQITRLDLGGMFSYPGMALGTAAALACIRWARLPLLKTVDLISPPGAFAGAVARIGCFLTGCCAGSPTNLLWGVAFPPEVVRRHPTQLYESAGMFLIFFLLKRMERRNPPPGAVLYCAFLYFGLMRFMVEPIRKDVQPWLFGFSGVQWFSLALVIWCAMKLQHRYQVPKRH